MKTCSRQHANRGGIAGVLLALIIVQAIMLGGSLGVRGRMTTLSAYSNIRWRGQAKMFSLGMINFVVIGAGWCFRRGRFASLRGAPARISKG